MPSSTCSLGVITCRGECKIHVDAPLLLTHSQQLTQSMGLPDGLPAIAKDHDLNGVHIMTGIMTAY
jgi:hypothetical protein